MKIVFLVPYPLYHSPSQRFRFEQYYESLSNNGIETTTIPFFRDYFWKILYLPNKRLIKAIGTLVGFINRFLFLFTSPKYTYVFIHRELTPFGPPIFEWFIAKVLRKKIIYDFDDAIWHTDLTKDQWFKIWLRNPSKTDKIIKWSYKVSCGNNYLCEHARKFNPNVVLNPTTIDTENLHNQLKNQLSERIVIGWTGSHSTLKYLEPLVPIIKKLEQLYTFDFLVICNKKPEWELNCLRFKPWNKETEIEDLMDINFGLMPLPNDEWANGKCGFKALQYMALGMPALISPVGMNTELVEHGVDGFLCDTEEEWEKYITLLLTNTTIRAEMGSKTRKKIVDHYSVQSNTANFLSLFR